MYSVFLGLLTCDGKFTAKLQLLKEKAIYLLHFPKHLRRVQRTSASSLQVKCPSWYVSLQNCANQICKKYKKWSVVSMHESNPGWLSLNGYNADKRTWTVVVTLQRKVWRPLVISTSTRLKSHKQFSFFLDSLLCLAPKTAWCDSSLRVVSHTAFSKKILQFLWQFFELKPEMTWNEIMGNIKEFK